LKDDKIGVRRNAAKALGEIEDPRVVEPLCDALKHKDLAVVAGAHEFFIRRGEPGTENILIRALNKYGNYNTAQAFVNSGNAKLKRAAKKWLKNNLFTNLSLSSGNGEPRWGKRR